jgi:hypothetical protein
MVPRSVTVTKSSEGERCGWCHRPLPPSTGAGRPRRFCSRSHRQRAYEARRRADAFQVPNGQVIVSEDDLRKLHDRIYRLESAVEDVQADLQGRTSAAAYREAYEHLFDAAGDLVGTVIEPVRE